LPRHSRAIKSPHNQTEDTNGQNEDEREQEDTKKPSSGPQYQGKKGTTGLYPRVEETKDKGKETKSHNLPRDAKPQDEV
jgi:hypothetical protein